MSRNNNKNKEWNSKRVEDSSVGPNKFLEVMEFVDYERTFPQFKLFRKEVTCLYKGKERRKDAVFSVMFREDINELRNLVVQESGKGVIRWPEFVTCADIPKLESRGRKDYESINDEVFNHIEPGDKVIADFYIKKSGIKYIEAARVLPVGDNRAKKGIPLIDRKDLIESDKSGKTILHRSVIQRLDKYTEVILAAGAKPDASDNKGMTPLHYAAKKNDNKNVEKLNIAGANLDARDQKGRTPLSVAIRNGNIEVAKHLINLGASTELDEESEEDVKDIINKISSANKIKNMVNLLSEIE